jgi:5-methyltetrahydrofolate--homocysteine methyltransferase
MIRGIGDFIETDVLDLRSRYERSIQIVEGPLMKGMKEVGNLFGEGKMYLPQVIRSAMVMKKAVAALEPFIQNEKTDVNSNTAGSNTTNTKILIATVKGDVHDIGKNIVGVVLGCNGYDIIDLGVMVPPEKIIETAVSEKVAAIGLSGLITPSLDEMVTVAREMEKQGLTIPLLIGGATTSLAHTALRIAPEYSGPVVYVSDAGRSAETVGSLFSDTERPRFLNDLDYRYRKAAELHENITARRESLSLEKARENRFSVPFAAPAPVFPEQAAAASGQAEKAILEFNDYPLSRVIPYIDWPVFLRSWEMQTGATETEKLLTDANILLEKAAAEKLLCLKGTAGFFPAASENEDIIVFEADGIKELARFSFLRNQEKKRPGIANASLADFIAPCGNTPDTKRAAGWIGLFALSAGFGLKEAENAFRAKNDDYSALLLSTIANSLAEAFSEEVHLRVQKEFWGYNTTAPNSSGGIRPAFGYPACPDHKDKVLAFTLLDAQKRCGLELTGSAMIIPAASVCGMYIAHPGSYYFGIGSVGEDQLAEWSKRKGINVEEARKRTGKI